VMRRGGHVPANGQCAADLMVPVELVAPASMSVTEVIRQMMDRKVKIVPLVDEEDRLVGIVDRADALHALFGTPSGPDSMR
jgi:CBS domain-containing protein